VKARVYLVHVLHWPIFMKRLLPAFLLIFSLAGASARADVFRLLEDPRDGAQARIDLIQQAKTDISAVYFLAYNDRITLTALGLLRDARRRGVPRVRLIVDANFQHIPRSVLAHLRDENVEVRVYHPFTFRHLNWLFHRMHEKVVVVDGKRYITGGRNLAESYFGLKKRNYIDRDVYVEGSSAADAQKHFEDLWASSDVCELTVSVSAKAKEKAARVLDEAATGSKLAGFITLNTGRDWSEGLKDIGGVRFLCDPIGAAKGPRLAVRLAEVINEAKHSIVIESPYLVPSREVLDLLHKKRAEGVSVQIVTNSLRACDGALPYVAYLKYRHRLLRAGVDMREYRGPDTLHSKSLVIDGHKVLVGSYNIDQRSESLNTEVMAEADDEGVADELLAAIGHHIDNSWVVGSNTPGPHAPRAWRLRAWMSRFLLIPFVERQL
jgi:putative cardiolipin synthase